MGFLLRLLWELIQNVPLLTGLILSLQLWQRGDKLMAGGCVVVFGLVAALAIWVTEPLIFKGHRETPRQVIGNVIVFSILMFVVMLYLAARWSHWWTDLLVGVVLAFALAAGQEFAAKERFGAVRAVWLSVSGVGTLLMIRWLNDSPWLAIVATNVWFTLVMGLYKEIRLKTRARPATAL